MFDWFGSPLPLLAYRGAGAVGQRARHRAQTGQAFEYGDGLGDVLVIPAGVAHKNLGASADLGVVGAYPRGQSPDMNDGHDGERPRADQNIAQVPLPAADPVFGVDGPLMRQWTKQTRDERG